MSEELKDLGSKDSMLSREELAKIKAEAFAKDPDKFISVDELVMGAKFSPDGRIEITVGPFSIDQLLHVRARLDDKVQDVVDAIKSMAMQERIQAEQIKCAIAQKPGKMQEFARSLR